jgi:Flp pilus assembly protein TadG
MRSPLQTLLSKSKQRGAVAIIFGLALTTVFGFMGLSLDLAQTYDRKTELQNAADAAALAGAKRLVGTTAGIDAAVLDAQNIAALHKFKFQTAVGLNAATIKFSTSPDTADGSWLDATAAKLVASTIFFIKIDTRGFDADYGKVNTNFMQAVSSTNATNTFGRAVAGRFALGLTPIAVCALETVKYGQILHPPLPAELKEYGFRRGLGYDVANINPLGAAANKYLLNPVDIASGPSDNSCDPNNNSTTAVRSYLCSGTASLITTLPGYAFTNTGYSATLDAQFNARFNGGGSCTVPTDANIKKYPTNSAVAGSPSKWMTTAPGAGNQGVKLTTGSTNIPFTPPAANAKDWGVLWSYNPAVQYAASPPSGGYTPYTTSNWPTLYPTTAAPTQPAALPAYPTSTTLGVPPAPYNQSTGNQFFSAGAGARDRRILNVAIADCTKLVKNGKCSTIKILGIGRFFMPVESSLPSNLFLEFAGLVPEGTLTADIKLYH